MSGTSQRFPIRFGPVNAVLMTPLGMGRRRSFVEVTEDHVRVKMGWALTATVPRSSIAGVRRRGRVWWAFGVHSIGWSRSRWIVNGSGRGMVEVVVDPPVPARTVGISVRLREVWVSLDDPEAFVAAVGG